MSTFVGQTQSGDSFALIVIALFVFSLASIWFRSVHWHPRMGPPQRPVVYRGAKMGPQYRAYYRNAMLWNQHWGFQRGDTGYLTGWWSVDARQWPPRIPRRTESAEASAASENRLFARWLRSGTTLQKFAAILAHGLTVLLALVLTFGLLALLVWFGAPRVL